MQDASERQSIIRSYKDLVAWQKARELVRAVYDATKRLPREELYGLTQQLRRAAISVPSNIAEGYGRGTRKDYIRFLQTARGSLYEVETQLILAEDLGYLRPELVEPLAARIEECSKVLHGLINALAKETGTT
ncbi:MAG TPA: four helix bundle protein [Phycisphaerae bacterium]|nr:four helix bundle protein [Phycisphaerae bacterium]HUT58771.1 four helix bundle protein [Phycisphaerae bacterium]